MIRINTENKIVDVLLDMASEILGVKVEGNNCREVYDYLVGGFDVVYNGPFSCEKATIKITEGKNFIPVVSFTNQKSQEEFSKLNKLFFVGSKEDFAEEYEFLSNVPREDELTNESFDYFVGVPTIDKKNKKDYLNIINMLKEFAKKKHEKANFMNTCKYSQVIAEIDENGEADFHCGIVISDDVFDVYFRILLFFQNFINQSFSTVNKLSVSLLYNTVDDYKAFKKNEEANEKEFEIPQIIDVEYEEFKKNYVYELDDLMLIKRDLFKAQRDDSSKLHSIDFAISMIEKAPVLIYWFDKDVRYNKRVLGKFLSESKSRYMKDAEVCNKVLNSEDMQEELSKEELEDLMYPPEYIDYLNPSVTDLLEHASYPLYFRVVYDIEELKKYPSMYNMAQNSIYKYDIVNEEEWDQYVKDRKSRKKNID